MKKISTRQMVLAGLFMALGLVLPFFTGQIPQIGSMLLPMHLPVLLCGFVCGGPLGAVVGFVVPLLRSALWGMPPMYPTAVAMAFELATYGFVCGVLGRHAGRKITSIYASLVLAMVAGRLVWGVVRLVQSGIAGSPFGMPMFISGAVTGAIPGILLQLVLVPVVVLGLYRAGFGPTKEQKY